MMVSVARRGLPPRLRFLIASTFLVCVLRAHAAVPTLTIGNATVTAPPVGTTNAVFTVALSQPAGQTVTVTYATANGSATAGKDYVAASGLVTFNPGETNKVMAVTVNAQTINQPVKTFVVNLANPVNAAILAGQGTGAILNNVPPPSISIVGSVVTAPSTGTLNAIFRVNLSAPSGQTIAVTFATADGSAIAGKDYLTASSILSFSPGQLFKTIAVPVFPQAPGQPTKTFVVNLSNPANATLLVPQGVGTILNAFAFPEMTLSDATVTSSANTATNATFVLSLSQSSSQIITVNYATADGTAVAGSDYVEARGTLTFGAGETAKTLSVTVNPQASFQPTKTFTLNLTNPANATLVVSQGLGTILAGVPPPLPAVTVSDVTLTAPTTGTATAAFTVSLSTASPLPVAVDYASVDGSAVAGKDYVAAAGTLVFAPGQTNQGIAVPVNAQTLNQPARTFALNLTNPVNAAISVGQATGTILSGVAPPAISFTGATVTAPIAGTTNALFTVGLSAPSGYRVTVDFATLDGTAIAGTDYVGTNGTVTFNPGETSKTISITVNPQSLNQPARIFGINLNNPLNATVLNGQASATILSSVAPPTLNVSGVTVTAPVVGTTNAVFTVDLSAPSGYRVTVDFATLDGTAIAGTDYVGTNGTVTFNPGETSKTFAVPVNPQTLNQPARIFGITLDNPVNATILNGQASATILSSVAPPMIQISDASVTPLLDGTTNLLFSVGLSAPSGSTVTVAYATADGTAVAGTDYLAASGTLAFKPGETNHSIPVTVLPQTVPKPGGVFYLDLSAPVNATLAQTQGTARIVVGNLPPVVQITSPINDATFSPGADVAVEIQATDPDGAVRQVDLYVGATLVGSLTNGPYVFSLSNVGVGDYYLKATAHDNLGATATSSTLHIAVTGVSGDVAIVRNADDPEIGTLQDYLLEMGYSSQTFRPGELSGEVASRFQLLIWDDVGATPSGLTDTLVGVFNQAFNNGTPLYFIGDNLTVAATNLSAASAALWTNLLHLQSSAGAGGDGKITFPDPTAHPVSNGRFGVVTDFSYPLAVRAARQTTAGDDQGTILATSGDADVLIAFPTDTSSPVTRSVTESFRVTNGAEADSLAVRKALFQNTVCYLLRCPLCDLTDMSLQMTVDTDTAVSGSNLVYSLLIQKFAECEGTGVKVTDFLPPNVRFVTAQSPSGTWTYQDGAVVFALGHFGNGASATLTITVMPTNTTTLTNTATVSANEGDPNLSNNSQTLETPVGGSSLQLTLSLLANGLYQLSIAGISGGSGVVETSTNLTDWNVLTNFTSAGATFRFVDPDPVTSRWRFYRARMP